MKKQVFTLTAGLALAAAALPAQPTAQAGGGAGASTGQSIPLTFNFQQVGTISATAGDGFDGVILRNVMGAGPVITGKPMSATEERKTVQTLGDGTELVNSDTNLFYRDVLGRTRTEQTFQGRKTITIRDPEGGLSIQLDPDARTAVRTTMPQWRAVAGGGGRGGRGVAVAGGSDSENLLPAVVKDLAAFQAGVQAAQATTSTAPRAGRGPGRGAAEDLGVQSVNGVPAVGTRNTLTIPAGQIGNNRDIHVVNERWYSDDLQMLIKSVNSDPRFGTTTYQVTDIVRGNPDPSLFTIPADYKTIDRAGRGGAMTPVPAAPVKQ